MKTRCTASVVALFLVSLFAVGTGGSEAELYFSRDKDGTSRVTQIREGEQVWIVVRDLDEDIDCDVRDKVWTDVKVIDVKTGAHIVWKSYIDRFGADIDGDGDGDRLFGEVGYVPHQGHWPGVSAGWLGGDYLEETSRSTGLFVSGRPFQIGTRVDYSRDGRSQTHIVGPVDGNGAGAVEPTDFQWGHYLYADNADPGDEGDDRVWVSAQTAPTLPGLDNAVPQFVDARGTPIPGGDAFLPNGTNAAGVDDYMLGRFENMDTLTGFYVDPDDPTDVALGLAKITDSEASMSWSREVYRDGNEAAAVTVVDPDENLHPGRIERVPVFIFVNPGSWVWALEPMSATDFWALNRWGGVVNTPAPGGVATPANQPLLWCNLYDSGLTTADVDLRADGSRQPNEDGTYYIQYPREEHGLPVWFATDSDSGVTRVMFYAVETGADTGTFELSLNSLERDLGFDELRVRDVLAAFYIDPNDQDDFKLAVAYLGEKNHSTLRFTDYARQPQNEFWLGRDPVYVEVVDANANVDACCPEVVVVQVCDPHEVDDVEWLILDELSSNSPVFFTNTGMELVSVWDALGVGDPGLDGGYSLQLDNWTLEAFNEDSIYARYNDVVYAEGALEGLGDQDTATSFPPQIQAARVANDVSFAVFEVGDTQVYDGETLNLRFLDRLGNPVAGYANSDCIFVQVIDPDQNEDRQRRERIAAFWDGSAGGGQNIPFGPMNLAANHDDCGYFDAETHLVNALLGDTNIADNGTWGKLYVLNPRNGRWAAADLLETGSDSGEFVSAICIDLVSQHACVPTLGVLPGDTILAAYQDPSNHSDVAWAAVKVSIGGAGPVGRSTTQFVDRTGAPVAAYMEGELAYVRVDDETLIGAGTVPDAVEIDGRKVALSPLQGGEAGVFITEELPLAGVGSVMTAIYTDPTDPTDTSSATIRVVAATLRIERFTTSPSPFSDETIFGFVGEGLADVFSVWVYDLSGHQVWAATSESVLSVTWDGRSSRGELLANGAYIYFVEAASGADGFRAQGTVFISR
ncbi:MAG: hypothetical protein AB1778_02350 [Candidatus Bipolaricaulota bacterium]